MLANDDDEARASPRSSGGFTLLEISLTVAILGVVFGLVYGVFAWSLGAKERAESRAEDSSAARAALGRITADLQSLREGPRFLPFGGRPAEPAPASVRTSATSAIPPQFPGLFVSRDHGPAGAPRDDLAFTATLARPMGSVIAPRDAATVRYFVEEIDEGSPVLGLFREVAYSLSDEIWRLDEPNPGNSALVLERIEAFELRFFHDGKWVPEWGLSNSGAYARAPLAVEVVLRVADGRGGAETFRTAVDLAFLQVAAAENALESKARLPAPAP